MKNYIGINKVKEQFHGTTAPIVSVDSKTAASVARDLKHSLSHVVTREVIPRCSEVNFNALFKKFGISPSEILFITGGISPYVEPYRATRASYFLNNRDEFWLAGDDVGIFDETLSWVIITGDDGQTSLTRSTAKVPGTKRGQVD